MALDGGYSVAVEGLSELEKTLGELPKATAANTGRRVLKKAGQPIIDEYKANAPRLTGHMADEAGVSTKLTRSQRRKIRKDSKDDVVMYIGAGGDPAAIQTEFGNEHQLAQPTLTPAWEAGKGKVLDDIKSGLWTEIEKSAARYARKLARMKG
jgi:HK97 gp10 family phage protein